MSGARATGDADVVDTGDRYELRLDGEVVALADHRRSGSTLVVTHTEVPPALEGRGLAGRLTRALLDDVRAQGLTVVPACPYTAAWIRRHPDYADLVAPAGGS